MMPLMSRLALLSLTAPALTSWLESAAGATVVVAVAGALAGGLRRSGAAVRARLWTLGLFGALAVPVLRSLGGGEATAAWVVDPTSPGGAVGWAAWTLAAWGAGSALLLGRAVTSCLRAARIAAKGAPLEHGPWVEARTALGIRPDALALRVGPAVDALFVTGLRRPAVVIPPALADLDAASARWVLAHEVAHVRHRDAWSALLAAVARAAYWPLPWFWWAAAERELESERRADEAVVADGVAPRAWARRLLELSDRLSAPRLDGASALGPSHLYRRLRTLAAAPARRGRSGIGGSLACVLVVAVTAAASRLSAPTPELGFRPAGADAAVPVADEASSPLRPGVSAGGG